MSDDRLVRLTDPWFAPGWKNHIPAWLGFPLFVVWFLVLLLPMVIAILSLGLWEMFNDGRTA